MAKFISDDLVWSEMRPPFIPPSICNQWENLERSSHEWYLDRSGLSNGPWLCTPCVITNKSIVQTHNYLVINAWLKNPNKTNKWHTTTNLWEVIIFRGYKRWCQPPDLSKIGQNVWNCVNTSSTLGDKCKNVLIVVRSYVQALAIYHSKIVVQSRNMTT